MKTIICPHCKEAIAIDLKVCEGRKFSIMTAQDLVDSLRKDSRRDVYACQGGGYAVAYSGGSVFPDAIRQALSNGQIKEKWPERNLECWVLV